MECLTINLVISNFYRGNLNNRIFLTLKSGLQIKE